MKPDCLHIKEKNLGNLGLQKLVCNIRKGKKRLSKNIVATCQRVLGSWDIQQLKQHLSLNSRQSWRGHGAMSWIAWLWSGHGNRCEQSLYFFAQYSVTPEDNVTTNTQQYVERACRLLVIPAWLSYSSENKLLDTLSVTICQENVWMRDL